MNSNKKLAVGSGDAREKDFINFKKMLKYFVHILRANNGQEDFIGNEYKSGHGYNGDKIRDSYKEWREFSNGHTMDVSVQLGLDNLYNKSCYMHWKGTEANIRVRWNEEKTEIVSLQQWNSAKNDWEGSWEGSEFTPDKLGLNDEEPPNEALKELYLDYEQFMYAEMANKLDS